MPGPGLPLLDELMADAWPPATVERCGRWRLRWTAGVTRRANSALAVGDEGGADLVHLVERAERFYRARGAPPIVQVSRASSPEGLADLLAGRGYRPTARTFVARAAIGDVLAAGPPVPWATEATDAAGDDWFDAYWSVEATRGRSDADAAVCRSVLLAPSRPCRFVAVRDAGSVVGVGQAVVDRSWAGVQCMATRPSARGRGVAAAVLHRLAVEAAGAGATGMYLAVLADNAAALALYRRVGFDIAHEYAHHVGPEGGISPGRLTPDA